MIHFTCFHHQFGVEDFPPVFPHGIFQWLMKTLELIVDLGTKGMGFWWNDSVWGSAFWLKWTKEWNWIHERSHPEKEMKHPWIWNGFWSSFHGVKKKLHGFRSCCSWESKSIPRIRLNILKKIQSHPQIRIQSVKLFSSSFLHALDIQNPPNTFWIGVWNPWKPSQEMFGGSNWQRSSQGIWKIRVIVYSL